jgi:hypothetical protein
MADMNNLKIADISCFNQKYKGYYLIENMDDLRIYNENIANNQFEKSYKELSDKVTFKKMSHLEDDIAHSCDCISKATGQGSLYLLCVTLGHRNASMIKLVAKGNKVAINMAGGYMPLPSDAVIVLRDSKKYTKDDIKTKKFEDGQHWYAFVRDIQVTDQFGANKWNTADYAYQMAEKFMHKLNEK